MEKSGWYVIGALTGMLVTYLIFGLDDNIQGANFLESEGDRPSIVRVDRDFGFNKTLVEDPETPGKYISLSRYLGDISDGQRAYRKEIKEGIESMIEER